MYSLRILLIVALIGGCSFKSSTAIECYVCNGVENCEMDISMQICTPGLAQQTINYLSELYYINTTAQIGGDTPLECMIDNLLLGGSQFYYLGCIYSNMAICSYSVIAPEYGYSRECWMCNSNGCNPANIVRASVLTVLATIVLTAIFQFSAH